MQMRVFNDAGATAPEVLLYDVIGGMDFNTGEVLTAKSFIEQVKQLTNASLIKLRINSAGGQIFDAVAIYNWLIAQDFEIEVYIDGLAASAASVIAMAGDKIFMPKNALMMVHNPSAMADGNSDELKNTADTLDKIKAGMIDIYVSKTGLDKAKIAELMDAETWLDAAEAKQLGFCTHIVDAGNITASAGKVVSALGAAKLDAKYTDALQQKSGASGMKIMTAVAKLDAAAAKFEAEAEAVKPDAQATEQIYNSGLEAERRRLKELDELMALAPACSAIIARAKYETLQTAGEIALEVLRNAKNLSALAQDAADIDGALSPSVKNSAEEQQEQISGLIAANINNLRGV